MYVSILSIFNIIPKSVKIGDSTKNEVVSNFRVAICSIKENSASIRSIKVIR
jgi:hypothetical protein